MAKDTYFQHAPCFRIGGINFGQTLDRYMRGELSSYRAGATNQQSIEVSKVSSRRKKNVHQGANRTSRIIGYYAVNGGSLDKGGRCYWCRESFEGAGIGVPIKITDGDGTDCVLSASGDINVYVDGCYCSFPCVCADILDKRRRGTELHTLSFLLPWRS